VRTKKRFKLFITIVLVHLLVACNILGSGTSSVEDIGVERVEREEAASGFGAIIFCEDVTEDGVIIGASNTFPEGTEEVWAYFNFWGMKKGQLWGRIWTHNGQEYINVMGELWDDLEAGWVAYSIGGSYDLGPGEYELTLFIGDQPVQRSAFQIIIE
jgi:hypothetical protein